MSIDYTGAKKDPNKYYLKPNFDPEVLLESGCVYDEQINSYVCDTGLAYRKENIEIYIGLRQDPSKRSLIEFNQVDLDYLLAVVDYIQPLISAGQVVDENDNLFFNTSTLTVSVGSVDGIFNFNPTMIRVLADFDANETWVVRINNEYVELDKQKVLELVALYVKVEEE